MNDPICDVFCFKCGARMNMEKCKVEKRFDISTGKLLESDIYNFCCPNYRTSFFGNNGHYKFKSEYRFRHSDGELHL